MALIGPVGPRIVVGEVEPQTQLVDGRGVGTGAHEVPRPAMVTGIETHGRVLSHDHVVARMEIAVRGDHCQRGRGGAGLLRDRLASDADGGQHMVSHRHGSFRHLER